MTQYRKVNSDGLSILLTAPEQEYVQLLLSNRVTSFISESKVIDIVEDNGFVLCTTRELIKPTKLV